MSWLEWCPGDWVVQGKESQEFMLRCHVSKFEPNWLGAQNIYLDDVIFFSDFRTWIDQTVAEK